MWQEVVVHYRAHQKCVELERARNPVNEEHLALAVEQLAKFEEGLIAVKRDGAGLDRLRKLYQPRRDAAIDRFVSSVATLLKPWDVALCMSFSDYLATEPDVAPTLRRLAFLLNAKEEDVLAALHDPHVAVLRKADGAKKAAVFATAKLLNAAPRTVERHVRNAPVSTVIGRAIPASWLSSPDKAAMVRSDLQKEGAAMARKKTPR